MRGFTIADDELAMSHIANLDKEAQAKGYSLSSLGRKFGMSASRLVNYKNGRSVCPLSVYILLANELGWEEYTPNRRIHKNIEEQQVLLPLDGDAGAIDSLIKTLERNTIANSECIREMQKLSQAVETLSEALSINLAAITEVLRQKI